MTTPVAEIEGRLALVNSRIEDAAGRSGRDAADVTVVAIVKGHPTSVVRQAYDVGIRHFGENRVEESEARELDHDVLMGAQWHMVGHVQSRKAKNVALRFDWVHSLDRLKVAARLSRFADESGVRLKCLLECNMSGERSKYGWPLHDPASWRAAAASFSEIAQLPNLDVRGLMTMAPWTEDEASVRGTFRRLRQLSEHLAGSHGLVWPELSMGMSDDFEIAIQEGATMIRLGRVLFGERPGG